MEKKYIFLTGKKYSITSKKTLFAALQDCLRRIRRFRRAFVDIWYCNEHVQQNDTFDKFGLNMILTSLIILLPLIELD